MAQAQLHTVLRDLRQLVGAGPVADLTDAQLLKRFATRQDRDAFAALVARHGPLVWNVCRRELGHDQDSEDAFQATFLVLARQAAAIRNGATVAGWLYRVAYRTALKARIDQTKRQAQERKAAAMPPAKPQEELHLAELQRALDAELARLPEKYQAPFVLCCLEGKTKGEAAGQLGWKEGTVSTRVSRARQLLRERLTRRGITLSAVLCASSLARPAAAVPPALFRAITLAAVLRAAGEPASSGMSAKALTLAEGVIKSMSLSKAKIATVFFLVTGLFALGVWVLFQRAARAAGPALGASPALGAGLPTPPPARPTGPTAKAGPDNLPAVGKKASGRPKAERPAKGKGKTMAVSGRVLGPDGKAVAGARVEIVAMPKRWQRGKVGPRQHTLLARARADKAGRFRLTIPLLTRDKYYEYYEGWGAAVLAGAKGLGAGWQQLKFNTGNQEATIRLTSEQVTRGRLVDLQGEGAAGVKLHIAGVYSTKAPFRSLRVPEPVVGLRAWPVVTTTDKTERFSVHGLGRDLILQLLVQNDRFARQTLRIDTSAAGKPKKFVFSLPPAKVLEGTVVGADTGKPLASKVLLEVAVQSGLGQTTSSYVWTDQGGHFRHIPYPGETFSITAFPATADPYLCVRKYFRWPGGRGKFKLKVKVKIELPRGVVVNGKVTEAASGKPVAGAAVAYSPTMVNNPYFNPVESISWVTGLAEDVRSGPDGRFRAVVYPGKGYLAITGPGVPPHNQVKVPQGYLGITGPGSDYVFRKVYTGKFFTGKDEGPPSFVHAFHTLDLKKGARPVKVAITLTRGVTLKGRLIGPSGKPVKQALMLCYLSFPPWQRPFAPLRDGKFEVHGCDPKATFPAYFLDPKNQLGKVVQLSGRQAKGKPLTIHLERCGSATTRLIAPKGKPRAMFLSMLVGPDGFWIGMDPLGSLNPHSSKSFFPDKEGRVTFQGLIPGVTYLYFDGKRQQKFQVEAGKTKKLPDVKLP
jgi:RNA polymerase sigma factor (sigma-70 family)